MATAASCDRTPSFCNTERICERTVDSATKCPRAISSAVRPSESAARTRASRWVSASNVACTRGALARSSRSRSSSSARSVRPMIADPATTRLSVASTSSNPAALLIQPTAPASRHSASTARRRSADSTTTGAPVAESGAMSSTPQLTPFRRWMSTSTQWGRKRRALFDDVDRRRTAGRLHVPAPLGQRHLQPGRHQCVFLDHQDPTARRLDGRPCNPPSKSRRHHGIPPRPVRFRVLACQPPLPPVPPW